MMEMEKRDERSPVLKRNAGEILYRKSVCVCKGAVKKREGRGRLRVQQTMQ